MDNNLDSQNFFLNDDRLKSMLLKLSEDANRKLDSENLLETFEYDANKENRQNNCGRKVFTPSKFSAGFGNNNNSGGDGEYAISLIRKKCERERYKDKLAGLTILNWLDAYNKLNETKRFDVGGENRMLSVYDTIANFFANHCFMSKDECIICEIAEIKIIDSLQVIECKVNFKY
jgi:hypothetical protein